MKPANQGRKESNMYNQLRRQEEEENEAIKPGNLSQYHDLSQFTARAIYIIDKNMLRFCSGDYQQDDPYTFLYSHVPYVVLVLVLVGENRNYFKPAPFDKYLTSITSGSLVFLHTVYHDRSESSTIIECPHWEDCDLRSLRLNSSRGSTVLVIFL